MKSLVNVITDQSLYNDDEVLYVSKSKKLIRCLKDLNLDVLYDPILNAGKPSKLETVDKQMGDNIKRAKSVMIAYCLDDEKCADPKMRELVLEGISDINYKLNARQLLIYPFMGQFKSHCRSASSRPTPKHAPVKDMLPDNVDESIRILVPIHAQLD